MINYDDTIAAIATPPGRGAIGIVRVSGNDAVDIVNKIFIPAKGKSLKNRKSHSLIFGKIIDNSIIIDEALTAVMRAPKSYSGDDTVEIFCHGGRVILQNILNLIVKNGARLAEQGEFTRRAFINGKFDLTQAEAVNDLINAPTELVRRAAVSQLEGNLRAPLDKIKNVIIEVLSEIEAEIEFPDDVSENHYDALITKLSLIIDKINFLLANADTGRILHDGFRVAIAGKPNAGKSSLLNRLAQEERALVTDIPGTTRDTLEADVNIEGFPVRFIDTAGLRAARGKVEKHGIARAKQTIETSDMLIWVCDASKKAAKIPPSFPADYKNEIIWVFNKCDLTKKITAELIRHIRKTFVCVSISAKTGEGVHLLHNILANKLESKKIIAEDNAPMLKVRHISLLKNADALVKRAVKNLKSNIMAELAVADLRDALNSIGEITGEFTSEDLLDKIFSNFCIGK